jgi:arylsulfatase A-like enzyme
MQDANMIHMSGNFVEYLPGTDFPGKIGKTIDDSTEAWPVPKKAADGAPNVLFYVLDDVGFGQLSPYGGLVKAPNLQRVADKGVTYTNFHTTGLCSPTRTCIMTGRNHHTNAMGSISEWSTGYPGYNGRMPFKHGFMSEILTEEGYNTFAIGKWHLSVSTEETMAGPFDTWPLRRGFDRYYGFLPGETDQWYPDLTYDNHPVTAPASPEDGYHLSKDLADKSIEFIGDAHMVSPDKPFFLYFCPGAGHAPHHIFKEEADKYKGVFDDGWDKYRETVFANQKKLGIFPEDTVISPHDPDVPEWDTLSDDEKKLYTRMMEVYAGFVTYTDEQFGRILDYLESIDELDNTLILFISDNGASPEGGQVGSLNEYDFFNFLDEDLENNLKHLDELGSPESYNHYAWGWANAGNTPFRRWKKETFRGATTDPFIISWPAKLQSHGEFRHQYGHAIDMVPTALDLIGIRPPDSLKGVKQAPMQGVSLATSLFDSDAAEEHTVQYFEMFGCRSIYQDGWRAECGWPGPNYAEGAKKGHTDGDPIHAADLEELEKSWMLFNLKDDPAEANDIAADHPDKLKELIDLWWSEAEKHDVLPLQGTMGQRFDYPRPMPGSSTEHYELFPGSPMPSVVQPAVFNRTHTITAKINVPKGGAEGVIYASGAHTGGYTLFVKDDKLHFAYNYLARKMFRIDASDKLTDGDHTIVYEFEVTGQGNHQQGEGNPGTGTLVVDGKKVGSVDMDVTVPFIFSIEGISVGHDYGDSVDHANYKPTFPFTGTVERVTFDITGDAVKNAEAQTRKAMSHQ